MLQSEYLERLRAELKVILENRNSCESKNMEEKVLSELNDMIASSREERLSRKLKS